MLDLGWPELAVVAIVLVLVVGPKDMPRVLRAFAKFMGKARAMAHEFQTSMMEVANQDELRDVKKALQDAKSGNFDEIASGFDGMKEGVESIKASAQEIKGEAEAATKPKAKTKAAPKPASKNAASVKVARKKTAKKSGKAAS